ncbi:MAG: hypothetical protein C5S49_03295 [Candidatus Methanogaster sp.]|nr:MAG: hypothetical protein C5S49_03295 [ANME-2 cluster archaeon]
MSVEKKDESDRILNTFDRNISQIEKCLENDLKEVSIILIVTTFEAFLKDVFKFCKTLWFSHTTEQANPKLVTPNARKTLRKYLKGINAYDEFLKTRYVYSNMFDPDTISLNEVLFKNQMGKINFQNLTNENGVKVAYKAFFDICLYNLLDANERNSNKMWEKLINLFEERHEIVHKGIATEFSEDEIRRVLGSIKYLEDCLIQKLINYELGCGSGPFFRYYRKQSF